MKYSNWIKRTISSVLNNHHLEVFDYLIPIREKYASLSNSDKKIFRRDVIQLLEKEEYLEPLIYICKEINIQEACSLLIRFFLFPPKIVKESGRELWVDGFRSSLMISMSCLNCQKALNLFEDIMENKLKDVEIIQGISIEYYGVLLQALTRMGSSKSKKYFGWWLAIAPKLDRKIIGIAGQLKEQIELKEVIKQCLENDGSLQGAGTVRSVLHEIFVRDGYNGLKSWLKGLILNKQSRDYLKWQIAVMLSGRDSFNYFKRMISKADFEQIGLDYNDISKKFFDNGWAKRKNSLEAYLTVDLGSEKKSMSKVFGRDFKKILPILGQIVEKYLPPDVNDESIVNELISLPVRGG